MSPMLTGWPGGDEELDDGAPAGRVALLDPPQAGLGHVVKVTSARTGVGGCSSTRSMADTSGGSQCSS